MRSLKVTFASLFYELLRQGHNEVGLHFKAIELRQNINGLNATKKSMDINFNLIFGRENPWLKDHAKIN
jgi:hypothetical protein